MCLGTLSVGDTGWGVTRGRSTAGLPAAAVFSADSAVAATNVAERTVGFENAEIEYILARGAIVARSGSARITFADPVAIQDPEQPSRRVFGDQTAHELDIIASDTAGLSKIECLYGASRNLVAFGLHRLKWSEPACAAQATDTRPPPEVTGISTIASKCTSFARILHKLAALPGIAGPTVLLILAAVTCRWPSAYLNRLLTDRSARIMQATPWTSGSKLHC